jgi:large subunit ribosomal protein L6
MIKREFNFSIPQMLSISLCYFNKKKYLLLNDANSASGSIFYYILLLPNIIIRKINATYLIFAVDNSLSSIYFLKKVLYLTSSQFTKFLLLKGLGLKVFLSKNLLELKLGYSHKEFVEIDPEVYCAIGKNIIFLKSKNKSLLGNLVCKIRNLRIPDIYKGKGIWLKNEKISLKPIKKK